MKNQFLSTILAIILTCSGMYLSAQVAINTDGSVPDNSAMLDVKSTTKGILVPRMTTAQRDAISNPANGLLIFCTDNNQYYSYKGTTTTGLWVSVGSQWSTYGSNISYMAGNVGIGTSSPVHSRLEINGSVGSAVSIFGADKYGVAIQADNPGIGFNYFNDGGTKTIKAGYGSTIGMDQVSGDLYFGNFNGNQSTSDFGSISGYQRIATFSKYGNLSLGILPADTWSESLAINSNDYNDAVGLYYLGSLSGTIKASGINTEIAAKVSDGTSPKGNLILQADGFLVGWLPAGDVLIGTRSNPKAKLHVEGSEGNTIAIFRRNNTSQGISILGDWPGILSNCYFNGGVKTMAPTGYSAAVNFNQEDGSIDFLNYPLANTGANVNINLVESMRICRDGRVAIGTTTPATGYALSVNGKMSCEEILIDDSGFWPDYVFEENYPLLSLDAFAENIKKNKHLPGMTSAAEVTENGGHHVGDIQKKTLEKVEELCLYIIELNNRVKVLEKENQELKTQFSK